MKKTILLYLVMVLVPIGVFGAALGAAQAAAGTGVSGEVNLHPIADVGGGAAITLLFFREFMAYLKARRNGDTGTRVGEMSVDSLKMAVRHEFRNELQRVVTQFEKMVEGAREIMRDLNETTEATNRGIAEIATILRERGRRG